MSTCSFATSRAATLLASSIVAVALLLPGAATGQHLGDVICTVDAAFDGTIVAMKEAPSAAQGAGPALRYELTVKVDNALKGVAANSTQRLDYPLPAPARHLREGMRGVFLLTRGKLVRIEPAEHAGIVKKLLNDPLHCRR
jgi:hypothetical protein